MCHLPGCVQQAEELATEANRTLAQARSAVASAKQNGSGFFFQRSRENGKIHRVSSVAEVNIS